MNKLSEEYILQNLVNCLIITDKQSNYEYNDFRGILNSVTDKRIIYDINGVRLSYFEAGSGYFMILQNLEKDKNYLFDFTYGNLYKFNFDDSVNNILDMERSAITGWASDITYASKVGLLNDFVEEFITFKFLENGIEDSKWLDESEKVFFILRTVFNNKWSTDDLFVAIENKKDYIPFIRNNSIGIPSVKNKAIYIPDEFNLVFESKLKEFDVSIYEFSFYFDVNPNHFNGEGFIIEINSCLYCFDLENEHYWVNRDSKNTVGYEKFVSELEVTLFIRLFNKLEDLFASEYNLDTEEEIKKYILTLLYSLEVNLELDSETISDNILDTISNIEKIVRITAGEINE